MARFDPRTRRARTLRRVVCWRKKFGMGSDLLSVVDTYLSTPATPDDRSKCSSGEISRYILQDLLPSDASDCTTFHVINLEPGEFGFQRICKGSGDVHFDPEIPNGNIDGM